MCGNPYSRNSTFSPSLGWCVASGAFWQPVRSNSMHLSPSLGWCLLATLRSKAGVPAQPLRSNHVSPSLSYCVRVLATC